MMFFSSFLNDVGATTAENNYLVPGKPYHPENRTFLVHRLCHTRVLVENLVWVRFLVVCFLYKTNPSQHNEKLFAVREKKVGIP